MIGNYITGFLTLQCNSLCSFTKIYSIIEVGIFTLVSSIIILGSKEFLEMGFELILTLVTNSGIMWGVSYVIYLL